MLGSAETSRLSCRLAAARKAFAGFIRDNELNADQIEFVDMIINALSINGVVSPSQLYEQPFTLLNDRGLSGLFDVETSATVSYTHLTLPTILLV